MIIKNKPITRIATLFLALSVLFTTINLTPFIVYATQDVSGENSGGGNANMNNYAGDSSNAYRTWDNHMGGYRFYIINSNLERVSQVYDFLISEPFNVADWQSGTRFDILSSPSGVKMLSFNDLAEFTGSDVSIIPRPVSNGAGQGEEFYKWFLFGDPYTEDVNIGGGIISSGFTGSHYVGTHPNQDIPNQPTQEELNKTGLYRDGNPLSVTHSSAVSKGYSLGFDNNITLISSLPNRAKAIANSLNNNTNYNYYTEQIKYAYNTLNMCKFDAELYALNKVYSQVRSSVSVLGTGTGGNAGVGALVSISSTDAMNIAKYVAYRVYAKYKTGTPVVSISSQQYQPTDKLLATNTINLLTQQIPLSNNTGVSPAKRLLDDKRGIKVAGYDTAFLALQDHHFLVVEPITWLCVPTGNTYPQARTYGSYYNIANKWASQGGPDEKSFYTSYMTKLGNNCLTVNETMVTESGKTLLPATVKARTISQSVAEMEVSGLSMHIYQNITLNI